MRNWLAKLIGNIPERWQEIRIDLIWGLILLGILVYLRFQRTDPNPSPAEEWAFRLILAVTATIWWHLSRKTFFPPFKDACKGRGWWADVPESIRGRFVQAIVISYPIVIGCGLIW